MKKLYSMIIILCLFLGDNAFAEEINFECQNTNKREKSFVLILDLEKKIMNRAGVKHKISLITETEIISNSKTKLDQINEELIITFNRYNGNLSYRAYRNELKFDFADFACVKIGKKLL